MPINANQPISFGSQPEWTIPGTAAYANVLSQRAATASGGYTPPAFSYGGGTTATSNLMNAGNVAGLTNLINTINLGAHKTALQARIPQAPALEAASSDLIKQELAGEVPADVRALLSQRAAEIGAGGGVAPDSPSTQAAYLRALGLTSLLQQQAGEQNLSAALARNPPAPIYDPSKQFLTAGEAGQLSIEQQRLALEQQRQQQQAALEAARIAREGGAAASLRGGQVPTPAWGGWQPDRIYNSPYYGTTTEPDLFTATTSPTERWLQSIGFSPTTTGTTTAGGTTNIVPPGAELDPNLGLYVDPSSMQAYSADTGAPVSLDEFFGG